MAQKPATKPDDLSYPQDPHGGRRELMKQNLWNSGKWTQDFVAKKCRMKLRLSVEWWIKERRCAFPGQLMCWGSLGKLWKGTSGVCGCHSCSPILQPRALPQGVCSPFGCPQGAPRALPRLGGGVAAQGPAQAMSPFCGSADLGHSIVQQDMGTNWKSRWVRGIPWVKGILGSPRDANSFPWLSLKCAIQIYTRKFILISFVKLLPASC